jgi:hypothetical protein
MPDEHPDDFKLPGGKLSYGEVKALFGEEFASRGFELVERMQAGDQVALGELMDLYFDYEAKRSGKDVIVLDPQEP